MALTLNFIPSADEAPRLSLVWREVRKLLPTYGGVPFQGGRRTAGRARAEGGSAERRRGVDTYTCALSLLLTFVLILFNITIIITSISSSSSSSSSRSIIIID